MTLAGAFAVLAERLGAAVGAPYWDGSIIDVADAVFDDGGSIIDPGNPVARSCRIQGDSVTEAMRQSEGFADGDIRFIVLARSLVGTIDTDAEVEVLGGPHFGRWMVSSIERDTAGIGYVGRGRLVSTTITRLFSGQINAVSKVTGALSGSARIAGGISGTSTMVGFLSGAAVMGGSASASSAVIGAISGRANVSGTVVAQSSASGQMTGVAALTGTSAAQSSVSGLLRFWNPITDLGGALLAFWDAERADKITLSGALVTTWADLVGGYAPTQGTGGFKPIYSATSFNGRPGITFDGADDQLTLTPAPATFPINADPCVMVALANQASLPADTSVRTATGYGTNNANREIRRNVVSGVNRLVGQINNANTNVSGADFSGIHIARMDVGSTSTVVSVDGAAQSATAAIVPATTAARFRIGSVALATPSAYWLGAINSVFVIDPTHPNWTAANQAQLLAFLKLRGGIS